MSPRIRTLVFGSQAHLDPLFCSMEAAESAGQLATATVPRSTQKETPLEKPMGACKKRKKNPAPRLSFADELDGGEEELSIGGGMAAVTDKRFAQEGRALKAATIKTAGGRRAPPPAASPTSHPPPLNADFCAGSFSTDATGSSLHDPILVVGAAQARGARPYMEDRHSIVHDLGTLHPRCEGVTYLCVLDGHGGSRAADFVLRELPGRLAADERLQLISSPEAVESALSRAFDAVDDDFLKEARSEKLGDGTTVLCALLRGSTLDIANVGDSRAVLGRRPESRAMEPDGLGNGRALRERDHEAVRLSVDHKPNLPEEEKRVQAHGGMVRCVNGCWRVVSPHAQTMLAVSRALGDRDLKESTERPLVSSSPFVCSLDLTPRDQFLILASDGLWDVVQDADAVKLVTEVAKKQPRALPGHQAALKTLAQAAADALVKRAHDLGSLDNTTALVAWLVWD